MARSKVDCVKGTAEDMLKCQRVFRNGCDLSHGRVEAGLAHFTGIDDRETHLVLQGFRATVPELRDATLYIAFRIVGALR
ncbi:MAG TPA: hypothetical protein VJX16_25730 [Terriglobales bacterium]|nr:hypothetical protein [Terriglobales bacterium]